MKSVLAAPVPFSVQVQAEDLVVTLPGSPEPVSFPWVYLRDNCQCPKVVSILRNLSTLWGCNLFVKQKISIQNSGTEVSKYCASCFKKWWDNFRLCFPFQCYHPVSKARLSLLKNLDVDIIPHTVDVDEDTGNVSSSETESVKNSSCFLLVQLVYANPWEIDK